MKPVFVFWAAVLPCSLLWVLLPTFLHEGYRGDVIELLLIGKEWVWSTRKHPMLPAWLLELLVLLTNRSHAAPFIASQICALATLWSVWTLGRRVLPERLALVGTLVMLPYWFFNVESVKYNQNITLIALWTLSVLLVFQAFQTNRLRYWIGAGVSIGLAFHSKYSAVFLVLAILAYMTFQREGRRHWKEIGPYLTTLIAATVFLPHLVWLYADDFSTLDYVAGKSGPPGGWYHVYYPVRFIVCEAVYLLVPLAALMPMLGLRWKRKPAANKRQADCRTLLLYCMAVPFLLHVLISAARGMKLNGEYGAAFWPFFGLLLLLSFQVKPGSKLRRQAFQLVALFECILIVAFVAQAAVSPYVTNTPRKFQLPMRPLGAECERVWGEYGSGPCRYISGDWIPAGSAAYVMRDRPTVHFYYYNMNEPDALPTGPWSEDADLNESGALILWRCRVSEDGTINTEPPTYLARRFPQAVPVPGVIEIPYDTRAPIPPLRIRMAIVPPAR